MWGVRVFKNILQVEAWVTEQLGGNMNSNAKFTGYNDLNNNTRAYSILPVDGRDNPAGKKYVKQI